MINIPTHYNNKCIDLVKYHTDLIIIVDSEIILVVQVLNCLYCLHCIHIHTSYIIYNIHKQIVFHMFTCLRDSLHILFQFLAFKFRSVYAVYNIILHTETHVL